MRLGVTAGSIATVLMIFPTGDGQGRNILTYQGSMAPKVNIDETTLLLRELDH